MEHCRFVQSTDDAYVGGEVTPGFIDAIVVTENQPVKAGDLLVKLDDRDYRARLASTDATVAAQEATLANHEAARRLQNAVDEQASSEIAATTAEVARTKYDLDRPAGHYDANTAKRRATAINRAEIITKEWQK